MDSASAEDLTCPVCQENFKDPFVLTCKHRYCKECLRSSWRDKKTKKCPMCRRRSSQELPPVMCILHKVEAQLFCVEDKQYVCLACVNSEEHTNHTFRSIRGFISSYKETKERSSSESEEICGLHDEKLQLFCQEDKQPVCVECVYAETHTSHTFKSISEAASTYKEKLKTKMKTLEENRKHKENIKGEFEESAKHIKLCAHAHYVPLPRRQSPKEVLQNPVRLKQDARAGVLYIHLHSTVQQVSFAEFLGQGLNTFSVQYCSWNFPSTFLWWRSGKCSHLTARRSLVRFSTGSVGISVWSLHVLPAFAWVSSGCSGFPHKSKDMRYRGIGQPMSMSKERLFFKLSLLTLVRMRHAW
ncbi:uncharacterized protein isoform X2 [Danio rerio]|uniref:Uncharacterized protein isoform X2 n=1 Tax=Danio rerio TaxID=7955 RepID=A0AC58J0N7_DANRE